MPEKQWRSLGAEGGLLPEQEGTPSFLRLARASACPAWGEAMKEMLMGPFAPSQASQRTVLYRPAHTAQVVLQDLLAKSLVLSEDWELLGAGTREQLLRCGDAESLLARL